MTVRPEPAAPDLRDPTIRQRARVDLHRAGFAHPDSRANDLAAWADKYGAALLDEVDLVHPRPLTKAKP